MVSRTARPAAAATGLPAVVCSDESRRVIHDVLRPDHCRERQSPAESLAEHDKVRLEALVLEAMHPAAAPETHLDLIDDD